MAGKYAKVIQNLPRMAGEEPAYQQKINAVKQAMKEEEEFKQHASYFAKIYTEARDERDLIAEQMLEINLRLAAIEQLLVEQYEVEETTSLKLETGPTVRVQLEPYAQVQDHEAYRSWCIEQGMESLMSVPWMTTNKITKERLLDGEPEPPGVKAYVKSKIVVTGR